MCQFIKKIELEKKKERKKKINNFILIIMKYLIKIDCCAF